MSDLLSGLLSRAFDLVDAGGRLDSLPSFSRAAPRQRAGVNLSTGISRSVLAWYSA